MAIEYQKTRMDNFFAKAAGSELADDSMEPITDREYWIDQMATKINSGGGGGGGGLVINVADDTLDKTASEIWTAAQAGTPLWLYDSSIPEYSQFYGVQWTGSMFYLIGSSLSGTTNYFEASSLDDYPVRGNY